MDKKIKIVMISDHMFSPSGCGTQTRYIAESLLKSGKFCIRQLGGAVRHSNYSPMKTEEYQDDLIIFPVDGYGNPDMIRSIVRSERPDIIWIMTDPRFWTWFWAIEDEFRPLVPLIYYHVWDAKPNPRFNTPFYLSNDHIVTISKVTQEIIDDLVPNVSHEYLPHAIASEIFKPMPEDDIIKFRQDTFKSLDNPSEKANMDKVIFFFNSRNARRKQSGTIIWWFNDFLKIVGRNKATLIMHTDPKDEAGQDLQAILVELGLIHGEVMFSRDKVPPQSLAMVYNMADCLINISNAEGFGLSCLESLSCGTPAIVTMTGGLQEQITDGKEYFGVGIKPCSRTIIGSQEVPYIYEDCISREDFIDALLKVFKMTRSERKALGLKGREHVMKNYNFDHYNQRWIDIMLEVHEKFGSWDTRKGYDCWEMKKI